MLYEFADFSPHNICKYSENRVQKKTNLFDFYAEVHPIFNGDIKYSENRVQKKQTCLIFFAEVHPIFEVYFKYN